MFSRCLWIWFDFLSPEYCYNSFHSLTSGIIYGLMFAVQFCSTENETDLLSLFLSQPGCILINRVELILEEFKIRWFTIECHFNVCADDRSFIPASTSARQLMESEGGILRWYFRKWESCARESWWAECWRCKFSRDCMGRPVRSIGTIREVRLAPVTM